MSPFVFKYRISENIDVTIYRNIYFCHIASISDKNDAFFIYILFFQILKETINDSNFCGKTDLFFFFLTSFLPSSFQWIN